MDVLPDDILLEIFDFYTMIIDPSYIGGKTEVEAWQSLVHVCRRWRSLVFGSPRRLSLQLFCTPQTPARDTPDVWPALPLIVRGDMAEALSSGSGTDNIAAALGQSNRVCQVKLQIEGRQLEDVLAPMQVSFPELTDLLLFSDYETLPTVIPDSFLDGSAPRLQTFQLDCVSFPGLPKLLLSAAHLVTLTLDNVPHSGYVSPEAMAALLSMLSSLRILSLGFRSPQCRPHSEDQSQPQAKRSILPTLDVFRFKGVTEYLEDIVNLIDVPQLYFMDITFFNQIDFDCPRLAKFVNRTPKLKAPITAYVQIDDSTASVRLRYGHTMDGLRINISCREPDWQLSSIEQVCNSSLHPLFEVQDLYIQCLLSKQVWKNDAIENALWLELLLPFTEVENLYLSEEFAPGIAAALQELVDGRITEVLPSLQNIFVKGLEPWGPFQENIGQFAAVRRRSGHPIAISVWDGDST